ncbi:MAG: CopD family protein [Pseudomonadota bacterium]
MLWFKALHVIFMVTWFAGLFYLPRLFVYHAMSEDEISINRFKIMEHKLYWGITTPGAIITIALGFYLLQNNLDFYVSEFWMQLKLFFILLLVIYHIWCGVILNSFKNNTNKYSHKWFRWFNEIPVVFLIIIIYLVTLKP